MTPTQTVPAAPVPIPVYRPKLLSNPATSKVADAQFSVLGPDGLYRRPDVTVSSPAAEAAARADGFTVESGAPPDSGSANDPASDRVAKLIADAFQSTLDAEMKSRAALYAVKLFANEQSSVDDPLHGRRAQVKEILGTPGIEDAYRVLWLIAKQLRALAPLAPAEPNPAPFLNAADFTIATSYPKTLRRSLSPDRVVKDAKEEDSARKDGYV